MNKKVFYIIFADILVASLLFVVGNVQELGFVVITFYAMCVSGVFGFFLRRSEKTEGGSNSYTILQKISVKNF